MGFGKRSRYPAELKDVDFLKLTGSQVSLMAQHLGVRRELAHIKERAARRERFKELCFARYDDAQASYAAIVLNTRPVAAAGTGDGVTEARAVQIVRDTLSDGATDAAELVVDQLHTRIDAMAEKALLKAADAKTPVIIKAPDGKARKVKGVLPPEFKSLCELASARIPILMVGPAGCGKTYVFEKVMEALGLEGSDQSCSEGMSESVFNGRLLPIGKGGAFDHVASPFMTRYEKGGGMLLDEMDAGDPNLFTYINKTIANDSYTVEQRFKNPVVKKHKDFVLMAAANTFGHGADSMYVGRNQLDAATLDRFKVGLVQMDYSREVEASLAPTALCEWAWSIRERIYASRLRRIMSTRVIKDLGTMTKMYGWGVEEWSKAYFSGWSLEDKRQVS